MKKILLATAALLAFGIANAETKTVTFNFNDPASLDPAQETPATGVEGAINVPDITFTAGDVTLVSVKGSSSTLPRLYKNGEYAPHLRVYAGNLTTLAVPEGMAITDIKYNMTFNSPNCVQSIDEGGQLSEVTYGDKTVEWAGATAKIVFHWQKYANGGKDYSPQIESIEVTYTTDGEIPDRPDDPTPPVQGTSATFNFNDPASLDPAQQTPIAGVDGAISIDGITFTAGAVTMVNVKGTSSTTPRLYKNGDYAPHVRVYAGNLTTFAALDGYTITGIKFNEVFDSPNCVQSIDEGGQLSDVTYGTKTIEWAGETTKIVFHWQKYTNEGKEYSPQFNSIDVTYTDGAGIEEVISIDNTPVEYFNLQGVRVANPAAGQIVIRRQGNTATKVIF